MTFESRVHNHYFISETANRNGFCDLFPRYLMLSSISAKSPHRDLKNLGKLISSCQSGSGTPYLRHSFVFSCLPITVPMPSACHDIDKLGKLLIEVYPQPHPLFNGEDSEYLASVDKCLSSKHQLNTQKHFAFTGIPLRDGQKIPTIRTGSKNLAEILANTSSGSKIPFAVRSTPDKYVFACVPFFIKLQDTHYIFWMPEDSPEELTQALLKMVRNAFNVARLSHRLIGEKKNLEPHELISKGYSKGYSLFEESLSAERLCEERLKTLQTEICKLLDTSE